MPAVEINGIDEVLRILNEMPEELFKQAKKEIGKSAFRTQAKITRGMRADGDGELQSRTGALARSIKVKVTGNTLPDLRGMVFSDSPYANIHEFGGVIEAKKAYRKLPGGPYLNIPAVDNKTPVGVTRETARSVFLTGGYIRRIRGNRYAVFRDGIPMYWLVKRVTIPARLGMVQAAIDEVPTLLSNLNDVLLEGLQ